MFFFKILMSIGIVGVGLMCLVYNTKLASSLQSIYVGESIKKNGSAGNWQKPATLILFKAMVIFAGLVLIVGAYPVVFGPIYINL